MDFAAPEAAAPVGGVEAVALGEPMLERPGLRGVRGAGRGVLGAELGGRRSAVHARALVVDRIAMPADPHRGVKVRQQVKGAGTTDGEPAAGIEAEEPDARAAVA